MQLEQLSIYAKPEDLPITLQDAKDHLRIDGNDEDYLITALINAATDHVSGRNGYTGLALAPQTWDVYFPSFAKKKIQLPLPPVASITSVTYKDENGSSQTLSTSVYSLNNASIPAFLELKQEQEWPQTYDAWDAVRVRMVCGYSPVGTIPAAIKAAIKLVIGDLYQNREAGALVNGARYEINPTVKALLHPYRVNLGL